MLLKQKLPDLAVTDPFLVQDVIFALSDSIRIKILKFLSETTEEDTGTIAKAIGKATNTTLYHLNVLNEAEIIGCSLKLKKGREIYHWALKKWQINIQIDLDLLTSREHSLYTYVLRTLIYYRDHGSIGKDLQQKMDINDLARFLGVKTQLAKIIIEKLDSNRIIDTIYRKILSDLMNYRKNGQDVRIGPVTIQNQWVLDQEMALKVFYKLIQTRKFVIDQENRICSL